MGVYEVVAAQGVTEMGPRHAKEPLVVFFVAFERHLCGTKHVLKFFRMLRFLEREYVIPVISGVNEGIGPTHAECEGMDSDGPTENEKGPGRARALVSISHLTLQCSYNVNVEFDVVVDELVAEVGKQVGEGAGAELYVVL